jgi:hypothetical protein
VAGDHPVTREIWWNVPPWLILALYLGSAAGLAVSAWALARHLWRPGRPAGGARRLDGWGALGRLGRDVLGHRRLFEDRAAGWAHALTFYGFTALFLGTCLVALHDRVVPFLVGRVYLVFSFALEWAGLALLAGVAWSVWRRFVRRVDRLERNPTAVAVLGLLGAIGLTGFLLEAARIAATRAPFEVWSFVGFALARGVTVSGIAPEPLHRLLWALHAALSCVFFALVGISWLRHLLIAPVQLALRPRRPPPAGPTPSP